MAVASIAILGVGTVIRIKGATSNSKEIQIFHHGRISGDLLQN